MNESQSNASASRLLIGLAIASAIVYGLITWFSFRFQVDTRSVNIPEPERPLLAVFALFGLLFVFYFAAIFILRRTAESAQANLLKIVIGGAIVFRAVAWFSTPIQEVDVYRYLWDGVVVTQGISPFRHTPASIVFAVESPSGDAEVEQLARLCREDGELAEVLRRVHFPQVTTVYPVTSQVVFAASALTTPPKVTLKTRLGIIKIWLLLFDVGTLLLLVKLLKLCKLNPVHCVAYGWCPLVLKEVANSAHLDSIAVFLTTFAVYLFVRWFVNNRQNEERNARATVPLTIAAAVLALAVGAKLYPVVLVPAFALATMVRVGWRSVLMPAIVFAALTLALLWPMMPDRDVAIESETNAGVVAFFRSWEMNDFLFMLVVENLKPSTGDQAPSVWFSVVPESMRGTITDALPGDTPFAVTRFLTSVCFVAIAIGLAYRVTRDLSARFFCEIAFLTLAWFWLLSPTQNPWYWMWALPFLPFVRNATWYAVGCIVMVYYSRFYFEYRYYSVDVLGSGYYGTGFFDFVVTWLEFAPWFVFLAGSWLLRRETSQ